MTTYNTAECHVDKDYTITINTDSFENFLILRNIARICSDRDEFRERAKKDFEELMESLQS